MEHTVGLYFIWQMPHNLLSMLVQSMHVLEPVCECFSMSMSAPTFTLKSLCVGVRAQGWFCSSSQRGSKGPHLQEICREHHCHLEKREQREIRDETENRGISLHPQTLLFQAFLIISRKKGTIHSTHTHRSSTVSSFSKHKKKKNQRVEARRRRDGVKDIDSKGDKVPYPQRLYSSLLLYYFYSGGMQNMHRHGPSRGSFFCTPS